MVTGVGTSRRQLHLAEEPSLSLLGGAREEHLSGVCHDAAARPRRRNLLGVAALACYGAVRSSGRAKRAIAPVVLERLPGRRQVPLRPHGLLVERSPSRLGMLEPLLGLADGLPRLTRAGSKAT